MIRKTVTYEDFDGNQVTEDLYFHLSVNQMIELGIMPSGKDSNPLGDLVTSGNVQGIMAKFRDIVAAAYGERPEGRKFIRNENATREFIDSPAFDTLLAEFSSDEAAAEFVRGMLPKDLGKQMDVSMASSASPAQAPPAELPWANREPTRKELREMTHQQLLEVYARKSGKQ